MSKNIKKAVVASVPANEIPSVETVVAQMEAPVPAPAKKKRRHARKSKAKSMNIVHVAKSSNSTSNTEGNVTTKVTTSTTVHTLLTNIEYNSDKEFTLKLANYFAQNPSNFETKDIMYQRVPVTK
jgi:BRCT domain type II-containing protein